MPRASILVPTHSHASTLPLAVGSALAQTEHDVEVLIMGDGVTPGVRNAATALAAGDRRVRFFDHPKGSNHGEVYRDTAIRDAASDAIFYLCDDDLLMRDHVADLLDLLETCTFVQSKNGFFSADGNVLPYAGDLAEPASVERMRGDDGMANFVSLTGTAHSRRFYLDANAPWAAAPAGVFPDWFEWRQLLTAPNFRGATSSRMTALQFPSSQDGRENWSEARRIEELRHWASIAASPDGQALVDALVARGDRMILARQQRELAWQERELARLRGALQRRGIRAADHLGRLLYRLPIVRRTNRR